MRTHFSRSNHGGVLMATLIISGLLCLTLLSYLGLVAHQNSLTNRSLTWNAAIPVVEAGIEEALTHLYHVQAGNRTVNGWGLTNDYHGKMLTVDGGYYLTKISTNDKPTIICEGFARLPASQQYISRKVRVTTRRSPGLSGMVSKGKVVVSGDVTTDSFDSYDPMFSSLGLYDPLKAKENGFLGTNSKLPGDMEISGNSKVIGKVSTGPGGVLKINSPASVGSKTFVNNPLNGGKVQTGWSTDDMNVSFPDVVQPYAGGLTPSGGTVNGTNYSHILSNGDYVVDDLTLVDTKLVVTGNARIVVNNTFDVSNTGLVYIEPGATLKIYIKNSAAIGGEGIVNGSSKAENLTIYGLPSCLQIYYSGTAKLYGTVYAPQAKLDLTGASEFFGASVTDEIVLGGTFKFHFDESLALGILGIYHITSWNEI